MLNIELRQDGKLHVQHEIVKKGTKYQIKRVYPEHVFKTEYTKVEITKIVITLKDIFSKENIDDKVLKK